MSALMDLYLHWSIYFINYINELIIDNYGLK